MKKMLLKLVLITIYAVIGYTAYSHQETVLNWIRHEDTSSAVWVFLIATLLSTFPIIPYGVVGGIISAKYGLLLGTALNVANSTLAAAIVLYIIRYLDEHKTRSWLSKNGKLDNFVSMTEKNPFLAVLFVRLIPILPAISINVYSAITKMKVKPYIMATALGKTPSMLMFGFVASNLMDKSDNLVVGLVVYGLFLGIIFISYAAWMKKQKRAKTMFNTV